jgi:hypothetical protein
MSKADAYASFLVQREIPDCRSVDGNVDVTFLSRDSRFCRRSTAQGQYYPEDQQYRLEFEPQVQHFVVVASQGADA